MRKSTRPCVRARQPIDVLVGSSRIRATGISAGAVIAGSFGLVRLRESRLASVRVRPASLRLGFSACAEISHLTCGARFREDRLASVRVRPASLRAGGFLLLAQEKATKENGALTALVPRASCARDCADALRGLPTDHPWSDGKLGAIHRAAPAGFSCARLPQPKGVEKPRRGHPARTPEMSDPVLRTLIRPPSRPETRRCLGFGAQERAALALGARQRRRVAAEADRRGSAMDRAHCAVSAGTRCRRNRTPLAHLARMERARRRCRAAISFGSFSLGKQRKGTGPQGCGTNTHGREWVVVRAPDSSEGNLKQRRGAQPMSPQGCGTNAHGRQSVVAKANTTWTAQTFGASRNPQWRGCGTNAHGRQSVLAKANTTRTAQTFGASRNSERHGRATARRAKQVRPAPHRRRDCAARYARDHPAQARRETP